MREHAERTAWAMILRQDEQCTGVGMVPDTPGICPECERSVPMQDNSPEIPTHTIV